MEVKQIVQCQICGRGIKANTGVIAHHGYERPGDGWQSASCMGARYLPYEVSCDMLPPAIASIQRYIQNTKEALKKFLANPPETLERAPHWKGDNKKETYVRPEGFTFEENHRSYGMNQQYELEYESRRYRMTKNIEYAEVDKIRMEKRLADWVQVWTEAEWKKEIMLIAA
jgi:hypothetical protein